MNRSEINIKKWMPIFERFSKLDKEQMIEMCHYSEAFSRVESSTIQVSLNDNWQSKYTGIRTFLPNMIKILENTILELNKIGVSISFTTEHAEPQVSFENNSPTVTIPNTKTILASTKLSKNDIQELGISGIDTLDMYENQHIENCTAVLVEYGKENGNFTLKVGGSMDILAENTNTPVMVTNFIIVSE